MPRPAASPMARVALRFGGLAFLGVAYLGVLLPGLPATPWLLLASWCFARSSPELEAWLLRSPLFDPFLRDWRDHRGMRPGAKRAAVAMVIVACGFSVFVAPTPVWLKWVIAGSGGVGVAVILGVVRTVRPGHFDRTS